MLPLVLCSSGPGPLVLWSLVLWSWSPIKPRAFRPRSSAQIFPSPHTFRSHGPRRICFHDHDDHYLHIFPDIYQFAATRGCTHGQLDDLLAGRPTLVCPTSSSLSTWNINTEVRQRLLRQHLEPLGTREPPKHFVWTVWTHWITTNTMGCWTSLRHLQRQDTILHGAHRAVRTVLRLCDWHRLVRVLPNPRTLRLYDKAQ